MIIERYLFCIEIPKVIWRQDIEKGGVHTVLDVIDINDALVLLMVFFLSEQLQVARKKSLACMVVLTLLHH